MVILEMMFLGQIVILMDFVIVIGIYLIKFFGNVRNCNIDVRGMINVIFFYFFRLVEGIFIGVKLGILFGIMIWCSCVQFRILYCFFGYGIFVCEKNSKLNEKYIFVV